MTRYAQLTKIVVMATFSLVAISCSNYGGDDDGPPPEIMSQPASTAAPTAEPAPPPPITASSVETAGGKCTEKTQIMCWEWDDVAWEQVTKDELLQAIGNCAEDLDVCEAFNREFGFRIAKRNACKQTDSEECWEYKSYREFVSIPPERSPFPPPDADAQGEATRLLSAGWNRPTSIPTTYVKTADLSEDAISEVRKGVSATEAYLGTYGPLRVFVVGTDVSATEPIVQDFCSWAHSASTDNFNSCVEHDQGVGIREIAQFQGNNGFAQHSSSLASPTQSFVIGNPEPGSGNKIAVHEYVHIYQNAHLLYDEGMPRWLEEGSAEFLALYLGDQQGWGSFKQEMEVALATASRLRSLIPRLRLHDIETEQLRDRVLAFCGRCMGQLQFETGQWATAWLVRKTSLDTFYLSFLQDNASLGWIASFTKHFGLTPDAFYIEFDNFMNLSLEAQSAILSTP